MFRNYNFKKYDIFLILIVIALVSFGIIAIGSATQINSNGSTYIRNKQLFGFIVTFVLMMIISLIDYHFIGKFYWLIYAFNIILLIAVLLLGVEGKGAVRWINIVGIKLQPSELSKIMMVIFLAKYIDKNKEKINKLLFLIELGILVLIPTLLIYKQPDLSTSLVLIVILVVLVFVAGISYKYVLVAMTIAVPLFFGALWYIQQPDTVFDDHQVKRVMSFLYPEKYDTYQTDNSIQAIGSGQLNGKGWYNGTINKYNYLPEPQTDFIFSIIGEEAGFIGCSIVLLLLLLLIIKCLWIAKDSIDLFGMLIISGFVAIISFQTFVNVGVATGLIPNTGIPLPFISYGLSSLMSNMIGIGVILNISLHRKTTYY
ncbi:rod shape-determining protein RodA [Vallitalea sp.]|jgi:rod shape determining protein RodA|uniref:rod shape-determining protein RodA n=1 Tax=Vallitalea sp. TaxID=1882829 RepID=UPI0025D8F31A|nr:rod shape-determining protein RodA [Vallitalea sp.]MCT4688912.1 rod shape-determining protein RodA [Vallitalea sp.]